MCMWLDIRPKGLGPINWWWVCLWAREVSTQMKLGGGGGFCMKKYWSGGYCTFQWWHRTGMSLVSHMSGIIVGQWKAPPLAIVVMKEVVGFGANPPSPGEILFYVGSQCLRGCWSCMELGWRYCQEINAHQCFQATGLGMLCQGQWRVLAFWQ